MYWKNSIIVIEEFSSKNSFFFFCRCQFAQCCAISQNQARTSRPCSSTRKWRLSSTSSGTSCTMSAVGWKSPCSAALPSPGTSSRPPPKCSKTGSGKKNPWAIWVNTIRLVILLGSVHWIPMCSVWIKTFFFSNNVFYSGIKTFFFTFFKKKKTFFF